MVRLLLVGKPNITGVSREKPQGVGFFFLLASFQIQKFKKPKFWSVFGLASKISNIHQANTVNVFGDFRGYRIEKMFNAIL